MSQRKADKTTEEASEWLGNKKTDPAKPMFMWVHYFDPHDPKFLPPQEFLEIFEPSSQKKEDILRAIYDAEVLYMDYHIGKLLEALKKSNLWDNTIVAVVADHGEGLGDHDWWSHGILYQEQIRVPLIIRVPDIKGGVRIPSLVRTIDLMPTILEAAGVKSTLWPPMDGESLIETMQTGKTKKQRYAYADSVNIMSYGRLDTKEKRDKKNDKLYCIMNRTHKLIYHQLQPDKTEFYNLKTDPGEMSNLATSKPSEMQQLIDRLKSYNALSDIMPGMTSSDLDRIEKLKSLGYIQ